MIMINLKCVPTNPNPPSSQSRILPLVGPIFKRSRHVIIERMAKSYIISYVLDTWTMSKVYLVRMSEGSLDDIPQYQAPFDHVEDTTSVFCNHVDLD